MNVHPGVDAAACEIVKVLLPTVIVAVRADPVFAASVKSTVPVPVPELPAVIVTQLALSEAVHAHDGSDAVTVSVSLVPPAP